MLVLATFFPTSDVIPGHMDFKGVRKSIVLTIIIVLIQKTSNVLDPLYNI